MATQAQTARKPMSRARGTTTAFDAYCAQLDACRPLAKLDERRLARRYCRTRDPGLAQALALANQRLVLMLARRYTRDPELLLELVQEGNLGLMRAIERFDPRRGVRLSSYAGMWIRAAIRKALVDARHVVSVGSAVRGKDVFRRLEEERPRHELPIDGPGAVLLVEDTALQPDARLERAELAQLVSTRAAWLDRRARRILKRRWLTDSPRTLVEVGRELGLSRERTRQLEERALLQLGAFVAAA